VPSPGALPGWEAGVTLESGGTILGTVDVLFRRAGW
jgi:hypothetical protein